MKSISAAFVALVTSVTIANAGPGYNGPVTISGHDIFYYTGTWSSLVAQLETPGASLTGLPTGYYSLPWAAASSTLATSYALAWKNYNSFPADAAVQYPNSTGTVTPYFGYSQNVAGTRVNYAAYDSSGNSITNNQLVGATGFSYAIAVSQ